MHCGNKTFMRLGILTQCHFPSLTWKECTSHNRLHHPAIKPCQGTAFWPCWASFDGKGVHRPTHWAQRGPPLLPQPYPETPCPWTWPLTSCIVTGLGGMCHPGTSVQPHTEQAICGSLATSPWADARVISYYCYHSRSYGFTEGCFLLG